MKYLILLVIYFFFGYVNIHSQKILNGIIVEDNDVSQNPIDEVRIDIINTGEPIFTKLNGTFIFDISNIKQEYLQLKVYKLGWKVSYPNSDKGILKIKKSKLSKTPLTIKLIKQDSVSFAKFEDFNTNDEQYYYYALQLFSSKTKNANQKFLDKIESRLGLENDIKEFYQDGFYKYIAGDFATLNDAEYFRSQVQNINYEILNESKIVKIFRNPLTPYYKIQIKSGNKKESLKTMKNYNEKFKKLGFKLEIDEHKKGKITIYKYLISSRYFDYGKALKASKEVRKLGFKGAYPVRYRLKETRTE